MSEEEKQEAKEVVEQKETEPIVEETKEDVSAVMDKVLDDYEEKLATDSATSTEEKTADTETKTEEAIVEPDNAKKEAEPVETEESEGEIPKEFHKHPAWIKQRERMEKAVQEAEELKTKLSGQELTDVEKVTSSPEYIRAKMEREGYKDDVIQERLKEAGHAPANQNIVDTVIEKLGYKKENLTQEQLDYIHDIAKVSNIISDTKSSVNTELTERLDKVESFMSEKSQVESADELVGKMQKITEDEGILDYKTDIEPKIHSFLDKNPKATQADVLDHFKDVNHKLTLERGVLAKKKVDRDGKKGVLNQNTHSVGKAGVTVPEKTGDPSQDADNFLDSMGYLN